MRLRVRNWIRNEYVLNAVLMVCESTLCRVLKSLFLFLGALDDEGELTPVGSIMSEFPLDPQLGKMLLAAAEHNCRYPSLIWAIYKMNKIIILDQQMQLYVL